jgi:hypothetical protein
MKDDLKIRDLYNQIIQERAAARGVVLFENVNIPVTRTSPDRLEFDGVTKNFDNNTRPFCFIGEDSELIGTINHREGTHPYIFTAFTKLAAALNIIPFPATMSYLQSMYANTKIKDAKKILKDDGVSFLGKLDPKNLEYFAKEQKAGMATDTRRNTRAGRIWFSVPSKTLKKDVDVIVFWCRERDLKPDDLKNLKKYFNLGDIFWSATDSTKFNHYGDDYRETELGEVKELKSRIHPELSHDDIVDILMRAHTGFKMTPYEKKVVWEFRGVDPSEIKNVTGGYPSVAEYGYRKKLSENTNHGDYS